MAELQPHQQRVVQEKAELDEKIELLTSFITGSVIFSNLEPEDRDLLISQQVIMTDYSSILAARIARF